MAPLCHFEPPPDFGCNMGEPKDGPKPASLNLEFLTCDNCNHFDTAFCCNLSVNEMTPNDAFKPTLNFGCKLFEAKDPPAVPVKMEFD